VVLTGATPRGNAARKLTIGHGQSRVRVESAPAAHANVVRLTTYDGYYPFARLLDIFTAQAVEGNSHEV